MEDKGIGKDFRRKEEENWFFKQSKKSKVSVEKRLRNPRRKKVMYEKRNRMWYIATIAIIGMLAFLVGCKGGEGTEPGADEFDIVLDAVNSSLSTMSPVMLSSKLDSLIEAGTPPQILSVRTSSAYEAGHIPGALNVLWTDVYDVSNLSGLNTTDQLVVYCYTGHTGAIATLCLNVMGYNSTNLKFGIMSWTKDTTARQQEPFNEATDCIDAATSTTIEDYPATYDLPIIDNTASSNEDDIIQAAVEAYLTSSPSPVISAQALYDNLNDGDTTNDPFILSVRAADAYAIGHIPGAANIPWRELGSDKEALKILPPDKQIVVYCYTGHTGGLCTAALNLLGYNAVNLKWGICSWTSDATVRGTSPFREEDFGDYEVETVPTF